MIGMVEGTGTSVRRRGMSTGGVRVVGEPAAATHGNNGFSTLFLASNQHSYTSSHSVSMAWDAGTTMHDPMPMLQDFAAAWLVDECNAPVAGQQSGQIRVSPAM
jgi:hypothetical protein